MGMMLRFTGSRHTLEYLIFSFKEGHQLRSTDPIHHFFIHSIIFKYQVGTNSLPYKIPHHFLKALPSPSHHISSTREAIYQIIALYSPT